MSEEELEREIRILMAREIVEEVCGAVGDSERPKCRVILHRILVAGEGFDRLYELSEEARKIIKEKLEREFGIKV